MKIVNSLSYRMVKAYSSCSRHLLRQTKQDKQMILQWKIIGVDAIL